MYCMAQAIESSQQPKRFPTSTNARIFQETENLTRHNAVPSIVSDGAMVNGVHPQDNVAKTASSQEPGPSSPKRARLARPTPQPQPEDLARLGIKVRDFAYESKLPPIPPFRRKPVQPVMRSPKRLHRFGEEDIDNEDVFSVGERPKLQRVDTEPVIEEPASQRMPAYSDLTRLPPLLLPPSQPPIYDSQESEPYVEIDTPLVTPNGSLNWGVKDASSIPASQLGAVSQATVPGLISMTQLALAQLADLQKDDMDIEPVAVSVPASPTPAAARLASPFPTKAPSPPIPPSSPPATPPATVPSSSAETSPRYNLRKRPSPLPHSESPRTRPRLSSQSTAHSRSSDQRSGSPTKPRPRRKSTRSTSRSKRGVHS
ncbi:hypothetical protein ARMGADRAFT_268208 [Armillaria gallica]|uniref:Uncharacterized protein n=1 Tax=Armillaria gallica TaxID=47427 RepID=A0A2H3E8M5_ARMGA|nr:hypothetical protein ARMGADRAFT_268208 [Armillaria gallica]